MILEICAEDIQSVCTLKKAVRAALSSVPPSTKVGLPRAAG